MSDQVKNRQKGATKFIAKRIRQKQRTQKNRTNRNDIEREKPHANCREYEKCPRLLGMNEKQQTNNMKQVRGMMMVVVVISCEL